MIEQNGGGEAGAAFTELAMRYLDDRARRHPDVVPGDFAVLIVSDTGGQPANTVTLTGNHQFADPKNPWNDYLCTPSGSGAEGTRARRFRNERR